MPYLKNLKRNHRRGKKGAFPSSILKLGFVFVFVFFWTGDFFFLPYSSLGSFPGGLMVSNVILSLLSPDIESRKCLPGSVSVSVSGSVQFSPLLFFGSI